MMPRLDIQQLYFFATALLQGNPRRANLILHYETLMDLVPSVPLLGDSDGEDFLPDHFTGLVLTGNDVSLSFHAFDSRNENSGEIDMMALIEQLPGMSIEDEEALVVMTHGAARTIAAIGARMTPSGIVARLYHHGYIDRIQAIGFLKSAVEKARQSDPAP